LSAIIIIGYFGFRFTAAYNYILFCSVLFAVVVHAAGCDKQDSLMRGGLCGKLHGRPSQLLFTLQQSSILCWPRSAIFAYLTYIRRPC